MPSGLVPRTLWTQSSHWSTQPSTTGTSYFWKQIKALEQRGLGIHSQPRSPHPCVYHAKMWTSIQSRWIHMGLLPGKTRRLGSNPTTLQCGHRLTEGWRCRTLYMLQGPRLHIQSSSGHSKGISGHNDLVYTGHRKNMYLLYKAKYICLEILSVFWVSVKHCYRFQVGEKPWYPGQTCMSYEAQVHVWSPKPATNVPRICLNSFMFLCFGWHSA